MPVRFVVKLPKLKPEKRRRRKLDVLNVEFNITEDSLTLFKPSVADVDPTQIHKNMCRWNVHEKSCAPFQLNKKDARQFYSYYINSLNEKTHLERNNLLEKEKTRYWVPFATDPAIVHWWARRVKIWKLLEKLWETKFMLYFHFGWSEALTRGCLFDSGFCPK